MVSERNRVPAGTGVRGGRFAVVAHQEPDLQLTGEPEPEGAALRCGMCGQFRTRASAHRCPAPGLVPLSAATARVLEQCRAGFEVRVDVHTALSADAAARAATKAGLDEEEREVVVLAAMLAWEGTFFAAPPICWAGTAADEYRHLRPDLQDVWAPSTASVAPPITETPCTWGGDEFVSPRPGRGRRLGGGARTGTRHQGRTHTWHGPQ